MRYQLTIASILAVAGLSLGTASCGKKIAECNALIEVINKGVQNLESAPKSADPSGSTELKQMADAMDKVAADAAKVELSTPELKKFSEEYQKMAKEVASAAREMAAAADAKDMAKVTAAQASMDKAVKQEDPLVDSINKFCQAP